MTTQTLIQQLQNRIERIETSSRADDGQTVSAGCTAIDALLPDKGYARGTLIEWVADSRSKKSSGGCGADYLSMLVAVNACADGGALVIADRQRQFYPQAAAAVGVDLGSVVVVRPPVGVSVHDRRYDDEFYWAIDQALGCSAVGAVWASLDHVGERWFRRFQLSAEASGTMGLFVRPASATDQPSWAEVRWQVRSNKQEANGRSHGAAVQNVDLTLARCRGGRSGRTVELQIDAVTGDITEVPKPLRRSGAIAS